MSLFVRRRGGGLGTAIGIRSTFELLMLLGCAATAQVQAQTTYSTTRTTNYSYYQASDGAKDGLLQSQTIEQGNANLCSVTTYNYDAQGNRNIATTSSCSGNLAYAAVATRATNAAYNQAGSQNITAAGSATTVAEVAGLFPATITNALGQTTTPTYDPRNGALLSVTDANSLVVSWSVDDWGRKLVETRRDQTRKYYYYCYLSGAVNDTSSNTPGCPTPAPSEAPPDAIAFVGTFDHDSSAGSSCSSNQCGPFTRVYIDKLGRTLRIVTQSFDGAQQPSGRAAALIVQDQVYSAYGPQIIQTQPYFLASGSSSTAGSNDVGATFLVYDALGRVINQYSADASGSGPSTSLIATSYGFNSGSEVTFGTYVVSAVPTTQLQYSYNGLSVSTIYTGGTSKTEERDALGQLVRVTDKLGAQIAYQYDAFGNLVSTKDALNNQIAISYDIRGNRLTLTDPDAGVIAYCYDALGDVVATQNSNMRGGSTVQSCPSATSNTAATNPVANSVSNWTTMAYDVLGRMTSRAEPDYTSTWSYDTYADGASCPMGLGMLCETMTSLGAGHKAAYDSYGRFVLTQTKVGNSNSLSSSQNFVSGVSYDPVSGRVTSMTYPTGLQVSYSYTNLGFLQQLSLANAANVTPLPSTGSNGGGTPGGAVSLPANSMLWEALAVDARWLTEQQEYGSQVVTTSTFDAQKGRLTAVNAGQNGTVISQQYSWDGLNQLMGRIDNNGDTSSGVSTGAVNETFAYDTLHRLTSYSVSAPQIPGAVRNVSLQYNALGMLLYKSDVGNYSYNAQGGAKPHALQSVTGSAQTTYTYDYNGNLVTASAGKYTQITYTSFNLPASQYGIEAVHNSSPNYTWVYDEDHQRLQEVHTDSGGGVHTVWFDHPNNEGALAFESEVTPGGAVSNRHFLSIGGQTIGVLVSSSSTLPAVTVSQPTEIASLVTAASPIALNKVEYWYTDQLGSLITTTDQSGAVTQRYAYDPFGKRRYANGNYDEVGALVIGWSATTDAGTGRGYTAHEQLDDVGLVHANGRIYDPNLGRFLQADPLISHPGSLQSFNRYAYCRNDPLTCVDPSGYSDVEGNPVHDSWSDPVATDWDVVYSATTTSYFIGANGAQDAAGNHAATSNTNSSVTPCDLPHPLVDVTGPPWLADDFPLSSRQVGPTASPAVSGDGGGARAGASANDLARQIAPVRDPKPGEYGYIPGAREAMPNSTTENAVNVLAIADGLAAIAKAGPGLLARIAARFSKDAAPLAADSIKGFQIAPGKFDYLFGRVSSNTHNAARSNQLALEMKRLGVPDTAAGRQMLTEHFALSAKAVGNMTRSYVDQFGTFEVRESFFIGPSGKAATFESTFQVLGDGTRSFSSVIPRH